MDLIDVREYAKYLHRKQKYDQYPYSFHLQSVELVARCFKDLIADVIDPDLVYKAAWLHDSIEDTDVTVRGLLDEGIEPEVVSMVWRVTDGKGKNREERRLAMYEKCGGAVAKGILCPNIGYKGGERERFVNPSLIKCSQFLKLCDRIANVEHGIKSASSLFFMYKKEQGGFHYQLYSKELDPPWEYLHTLIETSW